MDGFNGIEQSLNQNYDEQIIEIIDVDEVEDERKSSSS